MTRDDARVAECLEALTALHAWVDEQAGALAGVHGARLHCGPGCCDCCRDGLTVFALEAEAIRRQYAALLHAGPAHEPGACAFLDGDGRCRVYDRRPYVCRSQGLPLRWLEQDSGGVLRELRDICPLNEAGPAIEELAPEACWTLGQAEEVLAGLQERAFPGAMTRVALRDLFGS